MQRTFPNNAGNDNAVHLNCERCNVPLSLSLSVSFSSWHILERESEYLHHRSLPSFPKTFLAWYSISHLFARTLRTRSYGVHPTVLLYIYIHIYFSYWYVIVYTHAMPVEWKMKTAIVFFIGSFFKIKNKRTAQSNRTWRRKLRRGDIYEASKYIYSKISLWHFQKQISLKLLMNVYLL